MNVARRIAAALLLAALAGCSSTARESSASSYLIVDGLLAASGAKPGALSGTLASDVETMVRRDIGGGTQVLVPTIFEDGAQVTFSLGMKDPSSPAAPSSASFITITRYRVTFVRSDGRNTPGVDVPYDFDGAVTLTVGAKPATATMTLVRIQAKSEAPLRALVGGNGAYAISTIATITFYGTDQSGHEVSVSGQISVNFADWGDPA